MMNSFRRRMGVGIVAAVAGATLLLMLTSPTSETATSIRQLQSNHEYDKNEGLNLPDYTDLLGNVWDPFDGGKDIPFFWYIPKAGGLTWHKICADCLNLKIASKKGTDDGATVSDSNPKLHLFYQVLT